MTPSALKRALTRLVLVTKIDVLRDLLAVFVLQANLRAVPVLVSGAPLASPSEMKELATPVVGSNFYA